VRQPEGGLKMLPAELQTLVNNFNGQIESYQNSSYNETQLCRDFLDKFIKILGWDVDNEKVYHESLCDASIKPKNTGDPCIARIFYCCCDELDMYNPKNPETCWCTSRTG
jgi:hypothetical protein